MTKKSLTLQLPKPSFYLYYYGKGVDHLLECFLSSLFIKLRPFWCLAIPLAYSFGIWNRNMNTRMLLLSISNGLNTFSFSAVSLSGLWSINSWVVTHWRVPTHSLGISGLCACFCWEAGCTITETSRDSRWTGGHFWVWKIMLWSLPTKPPNAACCVTILLAASHKESGSPANTTSDWETLD